MPDVIELLEHLAERPPEWPTPVSKIQAEADRRRRRRARARTGVGLAAAATILVVAGVVVTNGPRDESGGVSTRSDETEDPPVLEESMGGLTITPSEGLEDGDNVTLVLEPDPGGEIIATQCASEVLEFTDEELGNVDGLPTEWCGSAYSLDGPAGPSDRVMPVTRRQRAPTGIIDCALAPGRCVIMVGGGYMGDRFAPLDFAPAGPLPTPTITLVGAEGPIEDGQIVQVEGQGFGANAHVILGQCTGAGRGVWCDEGRPIEVVAPDGSFIVELRLFHDVLILSRTGEASWTPCGPQCHLAAIGHGDIQDLDLVMAPTDAPIRPALDLVDEEPVEPGQTLRIEGDGFQLDQELNLVWCAGNRDLCGPLRIGDAPTVDGQGRLATDYLLPESPMTDGCGAAPGTCAIAWDIGSEGTPPVLELPLEFSR